MYNKNLLGLKNNLFTLNLYEFCTTVIDISSEWVFVFSIFSFILILRRFSKGNIT